MSRSEACIVLMAGNLGWGSARATVPSGRGAVPIPEDTARLMATPTVLLWRMRALCACALSGLLPATKVITRIGYLPPRGSNTIPCASATALMQSDGSTAQVGTVYGDDCSDPSMNLGGLAQIGIGIYCEARCSTSRCASGSTRARPFSLPSQR